MQQRGQEDRDMIFLRAYGIDEVGPKRPKDEAQKDVKWEMLSRWAALLKWQYIAIIATFCSLCLDFLGSATHLILYNYHYVSITYSQ